MHRLLKRQLKKIRYDDKPLTRQQLQEFIRLVDQAYKESDSDRALLENTLSTSSLEMQELYKRLKEHSDKALAKSEAKYHHLIETLQNHYIFFTHDREGKLTYVSDSATNILGYSPNEVLTHYTNFLADDPMNQMVDEYVKRALEGEKQPPYEVSLQHKDGSIHYFEITEVPFSNEKGEVVGIEGIARDITEQYQARDKISHLVRHDMLTGISNRLYLEEQLQGIISHSKRHKHQFAMIFMDLDHFKTINDSLGHDVGDLLLQEVAKRIKSHIREEDIFARIGGDEFIIVLTDITEDDLLSSLDKIMELIRLPWYIRNFELNVSASIGIALYPEDGKTAITLMKNADIAMYRAKELGRNSFCFFTPVLDKHIHMEMQLEQDMVHALEQRQFELYYQPKMRLESNEVFGAEVLVRWNHPLMGLIPPEKFIPLAEKTGYIHKLSSWIIEESCMAIARFNQIASQKLSLSINVSIRQFQQGDLCEIIEKSIKKSAISPAQFAIEITESTLLENREKMIQKLDLLKSMGIIICVDDFGTGYSSLSYLHMLPIDTIKIDKSFIDEIGEDGRTNAIILDTIITLGKHLHMNVLAEGVEHEYQRRYLLEHGCDFYQGFLHSKPLQENDYIALISKL